MCPPYLYVGAWHTIVCLDYWITYQILCCCRITQFKVHNNFTLRSENCHKCSIWLVQNVWSGLLIAFPYIQVWLMIAPDFLSLLPCNYTHSWFYVGVCLNQILGLYLSQKSSYRFINMSNWKGYMTCLRRPIQIILCRFTGTYLIFLSVS